MATTVCIRASGIRELVIGGISEHSVPAQRPFDTSAPCRCSNGVVEMRPGSEDNML